jgi:hypothetical protein
VISDFLINLLAGILGIVIVLFIERQRRPCIEINLGSKTEFPPYDPLGREEAVFFYLNITNKKMPFILSWFYDREPALNCRAWLRFKTIDGKDVFNNEIIARWPNSPQPQIAEIKLEERMYKVPIWVDNSMDISPNEFEPLNVIIKMKSDNKAFVWCNESYIHGWRNENLALEKNIYQIEVRVKTGGRNFRREFNFDNTKNWDSAKLDSAI